MEDNYIEFYGEVIDASELNIPKAKALVASLRSDILDYVSLVECRKISWSKREAVVFDIEVKVGQKNVYDIHDIERIAVVFDPEDLEMPAVYALREDFPKTPHQYITEKEVPKCLCLYGESYDEIKLSWTPSQYIKRISEWLSLTSKGRLHGIDQPLEPLLNATADKIILPYDLFISDRTSRKGITLKALKNENGNMILIADDLRVSEGRADIHFAMALMGKPQTHGIINSQPSTLSELHTFLKSADIDLLNEIRQFLNEIVGVMPTKETYNANLILVIYLPKLRDEGSDHFEAIDTWAFWLSKSIKDLGVDVGIWALNRGIPGRIIGGPDENKKGDETHITALSVIYSLSRDLAALLNGLPKRINSKITLIGAGALGSQVFMNLIRSGSGEWTIIDNDCLLPHNLARHVLMGNSIGHSKAKSMEFWANSTIHGEKIAHSIMADVSKPGKYESEVKEALKGSDIILDISTSIAAARHISLDVDSAARRVSMFLNPTGQDAVMLAESKDRDITLDFVEMQYYRQLVSEQLTEHLPDSTGYLRYSNSCRDMSSYVPQENIAMYSGLLSKAFRSVIEEENGSIRIWSTDPEGYSVSYKCFYPSEMKRMNCGEWTIYTDKFLIGKMQELRSAKLPNETGGILVGSFDMQRKIAYIVDTIPSPPDSTEWPTLYIRGYKGLKNKLDAIGKISGNRLEYVGEWHSHPDGYGCKASPDDAKAFLWLTDHMLIDGYPALMLICAERTAFYIGQMCNCGFQE